ncbi:hypothetical protein DL95DRAFT_528683 [Leptodontidium sp. 2 PMI_412]|nr:hypothetical protein BKA61DRAFT_334557 [Leptodontidium sp. MPI-SDFR-AT-0119]KAH9205745.1 hypothetical protein DL95DRAFT_528683 [Leptodontidium sp. 2 PMI_412]
MANTTVLITGANRGIGKGLLEIYLARPSHTVIAAVRDPATASSLSSLPKGKDSTLIIVKIDSASETDAAAAVEVLKTKHGITTLDIVIANAGISNSAPCPVATVPLAEIHSHLQVNGLGPIVLFQAVFPLLGKDAKFVYTSSAIATIGGMEMRPFSLLPYGASKAFGNYFVRKIHFENEGLVAFAMDPGFVQTDMGNAGAKGVGLEKAYTPTDECATGIVKQIDEATREKIGGHFAGWNGEDFPW